MTTLIRPSRIRDDFIFDPSLTLYLPFYELDGASFVSKDAYGHLCTVTGALWTPRGRRVDGIDDEITVPAHTALENIFDGGGTFIAWINPASGGENDVGHVVNMGTLFNPWGINVQNEAAGLVKIRLLVRWDGDNYAPVSTTAVIPINTWSQIAFTYNADATGNTAIFYFNGAPSALTASTPTGTRVSGSGEILTIGNADSGNRTFDGLIGALWEYSRICNPLEIQQHYLATKWRYR